MFLFLLLDEFDVEWFCVLLECAAAPVPVPVVAVVGDVVAETAASLGFCTIIAVTAGVVGWIAKKKKGQYTRMLVCVFLYPGVLVFSVSISGFWVVPALFVPDNAALEIRLSTAQYL